MTAPTEPTDAVVAANTNDNQNTPPYLYDRLRSEATALLTQTGLVTPEQITLADPKANIPADLAFPVFASSKTAGVRNPNEWAQTVADAVQILPDGLFDKVEAAGGFVNFSASPPKTAREVISEVLALGENFGADKSVGHNQTVIVEYSSPNIAKKLHVGSLRTTVIGHSLYLILRALGYNAIGDNHLGDWGTQFGYILSAIHDGNLTPWNDPDPVASLMKIYTDYYLAANGIKADPKKNPPVLPVPAAHPEYKERAREWFKKLEDGDLWARQTWQTVIDLSLREFEKTYKRLGITFDTQIGESYFEPVLQDTVQEALDKRVATIGDGGAVIVDFGDESNLPVCLLRKSDGATLYQTRDAATAIYRWNTYHPARNIYVVGAEQKAHFAQVFEIARRMGYKEIADRSVHIPFGMVTAASGERFATRKGNVIFADEILDEAVSRARANVLQQIEEGKTELTAADTDEIEAVSETLGIGAVIYADLFQGPDRNIAFDWDKILSNDGNTSAYIQYTHARCRSILRKAGESAAHHTSESTALLTAAEEQAVCKQLLKMPHAVREAGEKFLPASVAEWTYTLAREFARFYHEHSVLEAATPELRQARLSLVSAVAQGLKNGLALLGIGAPERM